VIELPEALTIARQMTAELRGKRIVRGLRGNSPHKFAFYSGEPEQYAGILEGRTMGETIGMGSMIVAAIEPGHALVLGGGGERILYHPTAATLPKKHHLLLQFEDDSYLTVSVQGWGCVQLVPQEQLATHSFAGSPRVSPLDAEFTADYVRQLFAEVPAEDPRSIKHFVISKPGFWGVANGYLQDILFLAKLHPRRRVVEMKAKEQRALHKATKTVITQAVKADGRDTERDLYNQPGRYVRILDSRTVGRPCRECGTVIEKISYLGGAAYFCPSCQV